MKKLGPVFIILSACLWGTIGVAVKFLGSFGFNSMQIVFLRAITTVCIMGLVLLFYNKNLLKIKFKDIWCFLGTGVVSIVFFTYLNFYTITLTSLSFAGIMLYTAPFIMVFLAAIFFKERITFKKIIACIVAFCGCCLVAGILGSDVKVSTLSIITGVASGFFYALYTVFSRFALNKGYHSFTITFYTFLFSTLGSLIFINPTQTFKIVAASPNCLWGIFAIAVFNTVLPYILYTSGLKTVESAVALILATAEPVVATLVGFLLYNEKITLSSAIGVVLVVSSVALLNLKKRKVKNDG
ncbi:MAG: EamA family transporter [Ruminococcaceae bacterium]|nr:EamA family transporter [Oscillospiraceae bacterium]